LNHGAAGAAKRSAEKLPADWQLLLLLLLLDLL